MGKRGKKKIVGDVRNLRRRSLGRKSRQATSERSVRAKTTFELILNEKHIVERNWHFGVAKSKRGHGKRGGLSER